MPVAQNGFRAGGESKYFSREGGSNLLLSCLPLTTAAPNAILATGRPLKENAGTSSLRDQGFWQGRQAGDASSRSLPDGKSAQPLGHPEEASAPTRGGTTLGGYERSRSINRAPQPLGGPCPISSGERSEPDFFSCSNGPSPQRAVASIEICATVTTTFI